MNNLEIEDLNDNSQDIGKEARERLDQSTKSGKESEKRSSVKEILSWILYFVAAILAALFIKNCPIINMHVPTGSMENTIMPGDRLIGNRLSYIKDGPERGDVVVFKYPDDEKETYVKRVIGLPGETVQIVDGQVYINGQLLQGDMGWEPIESAGLASDPVILNEDEYFVLGDNRNDSSDSRVPSVGNVAKSSIIGRAWFRIWPMSRIGLIE